MDQHLWQATGENRHWLQRVQLRGRRSGNTGTLTSQSPEGRHEGRYTHPSLILKEDVISVFGILQDKPILHLSTAQHHTQPSRAASLKLNRRPDLHPWNGPVLTEDLNMGHSIQHEAPGQKQKVGKSSTCWPVL